LKIIVCQVFLSATRGYTASVALFPARKTPYYSENTKMNNVIIPFFNGTIIHSDIDFLSAVSYGFIIKNIYFKAGLIL